MHGCAILSAAAVNIADVCNWYRSCDLHDRGGIPKVDSYRGTRLKVKDKRRIIVEYRCFDFRLLIV